MATVTAWVAWAVTWAGVGDGVEVRTQDGVMREADSVAIDGDRCTLSGADVSAIDLDELLDVRFPSLAAPLASPEAALHLHDGSLVVGSVDGGDDLALSFALEGGPVVMFDIDAVRALILTEEPATRFVGSYPKREGLDTLYRRKDDRRGDYTTGTFLEFGADAFLFEYSLGEGTFPLEEIEALLLDQQVPLPESEGRQVEVDLWPDGTLAGRLGGLDARGVLVTPAFSDAPIRLDRSQLRGLRFGGSAVWASDLTPASVEETPAFGGDDLFLYPHRVDRTVTGRPLSVDGRRYGKGFGMHSRTSLTLDVPEGAQHFSVEVGVSDEVLSLPHRGALVCIVRVDGEERARTAVLHGGEAAQRLASIEVVGAKQITLTTDFGDDGDVADRAVWGDPLFVRSR